MKTITWAPRVVLALVLLGASPGAAAQSTDGYHSIQIFPVVVDSTSFTQRFTFRRPTTPVAVEKPVTVSAWFFPGNNTPQAAPLHCPDFVIPSSGQRVFLSLRELCPGLAPGSTFGYLHTAETDPETHPYAGYSRVSNAAGIGFSIEAFPAHTFTPAWGVVTGLRRRAATVSSPAFQTNCFVASLDRVNDPDHAVAETVDFDVYDSGDVLIGEGVLQLAPGKLVRMLDIFAAAGAPAGDHEDARIRFSMTSGSGVQVPRMAFCTVQDNSSFGADFRIGKQEWDSSGQDIAAHDYHVTRMTYQSSDTVGLTWESKRRYSIPAGAFHNAHLFHFRHPDFVQCEITDPSTHTRLPAAHGLEMRLVASVYDNNGPYWLALAGGANATGFGEVYLGDKMQREGGRNTLYWIEVESNGQNAGAVRDYGLRCRSGSGHPFAETMYYHEPLDRF